MGNSEQKEITKVNNTFIHEETRETEKKNVRLKYNGIIRNLVCDIDESLSTVFEKFKKQNKLEEQNLYFIHDGNTLNPEMKLNQINFTNNIDIYAHEGNYLVGGIFALNFTDISKKNIEEHFFSNTGLIYRMIDQGINIYGICKSKKCIAYNKEVITPLKNIKKFDLIKDRYELGCPLCEGAINPKTLGFLLCEYKIKGKILENDISVAFEINEKAKNNYSIQYFNPEKNGTIMVVELIIEVEYLLSKKAKTMFL